MEETQQQAVYSAEMSQPVETATTEQTSQKRDPQDSYQSGEDSNAQDPDAANREGDELSDHANKRFQDLANKAREADEYRTRWEEEREYRTAIEQQMQSQLQQAQINPQYDPAAAIEYSNMNTLILQSRLDRLEDEKNWGQVDTSYPEIKQDRALDDFVYQQFNAMRLANPNATPMQAAKAVMGYLSKVKGSAKDEAYQAAEENLTNKAIVSRAPGRRAPTAAEGTSQGDPFERWKRTGEENALLDAINW